MSDQVKVKVRNLTKCFGDLKVLDNISFDINKGDFVCIVGPTGCGKTTFLNLLVKLIEPTEGQILIDGEPADPQKHNLSFVFQEPSAFPWLTVEQNIRFGLETKKVEEKVIKQRTDEILVETVRHVQPQTVNAEFVLPLADTLENVVLHIGVAQIELYQLEMTFPALVPEAVIVV